jgi:hypothetical protein
VVDHLADRPSTGAVGGVELLFGERAHDRVECRRHPLDLIDQRAPRPLVNRQGGTVKFADRILSVHVSLFSNHEAHENTKETLGTNAVGLFSVLRRHSETRAMRVGSDNSEL